MRRLIGAMMVMLAGVDTASAQSTPTAAEAGAATVEGLLANVALTPADPAAVTTRCDATLALAARLKADLDAGRGADPLRAYDELYRLLGDVGGETNTVAETNPAKPVRDAAQACLQRLSDALTALSLSRPTYDRLAAIHRARLDQPTRHLVERTLAKYRRGGVDKDAPTRAKVEALGKELTAISLEWGKNLREGQRDFFATPAELDGLPADYLADHKPGADGRIRITTEYPDVLPVLDFARSTDLRRRAWFAMHNRAYPENDAVLRRLVTKRRELANLLGFADWAALATDDKMVRTPARVRSFVDEVSTAATPASDRDYARLLARLKRDDAAATTVPPWSSSFMQNQLRREDYAVDPQEVRKYLAYARVKPGVIALVEEMFAVDIRPWAGAPVWAPGVEAYELVEGGQVIGRFYLDMHPRDGKFNHAAQFPIRTGVTGRQLPVGALVCNFPEGLMSHQDVETFLHEFGHLLHWIFSGKQIYARQNFSEMEWDFVEAPSQLLEEWVWSYPVLARFAADDAGKPIPPELVAAMNRARFFGEGIAANRQVALAATSLEYYTRPPADLNFEREWRTISERYSPFDFPEGARSWAAFGHLDGYSSNYYTYLWSQAIALDLFSAFDAERPLDPAAPRRYREAILAPGSAKPAETLVQDFLGRPFNLDALKARLAR